jgi:hypothetical protein
LPAQTFEDFDNSSPSNNEYTFLMQAEQCPENLDRAHDSNADLATPVPKEFKAGALKGRLIVPENFLDPDPELESLFYDGQILSGVPDEELLRARSRPFDPAEGPETSNRERVP